MRYLPLTQPDRDAMLSVIGAGSIDELFADGGQPPQDPTRGG